MNELPLFMDDLTETLRDVLWFHEPDVMASERMRIVGIGCPDHMAPCMVDRPRGTDDYLFMYFPTPVHVWWDGAVRPCPAHTFFLWTPGHRHCFGHPQQRWCHCWMHCSGPAVEQLLEASHIPLNQPLDLGSPYLTDRCLKPILDELKESAAPDFTILESYLAIWVRLIDRAVNPVDRSGRIPERILRTVRYLNVHLAEPVSLEKLAGIANLSISRFSAEFRTAMGTSPINFFLEQRLHHAAHLLRDRNLNIAAVAEMTGFCDPLYFSRQFRRKYGVSPLQYRRKLA